MDDIVAESGVSRATIYRLYPGGKEVLFEALRVRFLEEFFERLRTEIQAATSLEDLLVRAVVCATRELRADSDLALQLIHRTGRDGQRTDSRWFATDHPDGQHLAFAFRCALHRGRNSAGHDRRFSAARDLVVSCAERSPVT
jgi:AcrR family transcriptional regulator